MVLLFRPQIFIFFLLAFPIIIAAQDNTPKPQDYEIVVGDKINNNIWTGNVAGGGDFYDVHDVDGGSPVKTLSVWLNGDSVKGIRVGFFSGASSLIGAQAAGSANVEFEFQVGERIKGEIILTGNGKGERLGSIEFKTSNDRTFKAGNTKTQFFYASGDSYLMGFHGFAKLEVDRLGLYMMKPIKSSRLIDVQYTLPAGGPPNSIHKDTFTNAQPTGTITGKTTYQIESSTTQEWSQTTSTGYTFSTEVSAKIPLIDGEAKIGFQVTTSDEQTRTSTQFKGETITKEFENTVGACKTAACTIVWFTLKGDIEFTGKIQYVFADDTMRTVPTEGVFKAIQTTNGEGTCIETPITTGSCSDFQQTTPSPAVGPVVAPSTSPVVQPTTATPAPVPLPTNSLSPTIRLPNSNPTTVMPAVAPSSTGTSPTGTEGIVFQGNVINAEGSIDIDITLINAGGDVVDLNSEEPETMSHNSGTKRSKRSKKGRNLHTHLRH